MSSAARTALDAVPPLSRTADQLRHEVDGQDASSSGRPGPPLVGQLLAELEGAQRLLAHALELENAQLRKDLADSHSQIADLARRLVALEETLQPRRSPGPPGLGSGFSPIRRFRSGYGGDSPSRIFCANCAGAGHTSAECRAPCRYCGHPGHLSDQCPTRAPAPPM